jgi:intraflagellar transport protein 80
VLFAQVVDRRFEWKNSEVILLEPRKIRVHDIANETLEDIEFARDRVVEIGVGYGHLVVTTSSQCYIYTLQNLNTPIIFDIKAPPSFLHLCKRHFVTLDQISALQIVNYEGRALCSPRFQGLRPEYLTKDLVALSNDTLAVVDSVEPKNVVLLDATSGRQNCKCTHSADILKVALNQHSLGPQERILAFIDKNHDMFLANASDRSFTTHKLHPHVESFAFNDETDVLVGLADGRLKTWYHPASAFVDKDLLPLSTVTSEASEFGRDARIAGYSGNRVTIRKVDGTVVSAATPVDISLLYELARGGQWDESVRLCRHQKSPPLWGTLAALSLAKKQLDCAEVCLSELDEVPKVEYIQHIKNIPSEEGRQAEMALLRRLPDEAERILLQASPPLVYRAVKMHLHLFNWSRALEIALKHKTHVDTVLGYRQRFLQTFDKRETDQQFLQYNSQFEIDWDTIEAKEAKELEDERGRTGRGHK